MGLTMIMLFNLLLRPHARKNLKLNIAKIQYHQKKVTFFGDTYTVDGNQAMPDKVQAVTEMTTSHLSQHCNAFWECATFSPSSFPELQKSVSPCVS